MHLHLQEPITQKCASVCELIEAINITLYTTEGSGRDGCKHSAIQQKE